MKTLHNLMSWWSLFVGNAQITDNPPTSLDFCPSDVQIVTFLQGGSQEEIWGLREMIGYMHRVCVPRVTVVYNEAGHLQEISHWRGVSVVDLQSVLFAGLPNQTALPLDELWRRLKEWCHHNFASFLLTEPSLIEILGLNTAQGCSEDGKRLLCVNSRVVTRRTIQGVSPIRGQVETPEHGCHLRIRMDIVNNPRIYLKSGNVSDLRAGASAGRTRVALLVPSRGDARLAFEENTLMKHLVPSLNATVDQSKYHLTLYLGYDHGDAVYESRENQTKLLQSTSIDIKLVRVPNARWLTMIWNLLYRLAIEDQNDYFYQLGDDIQFMEAGWLDFFVERLKGGVGVVAPNDLGWPGCMLFTLAFVSRKHFDTFGYLFPPGIRDWYCDNWMTEVYPVEHRHCSTSFNIRNCSGGARYKACESFDWRAQVNEDRRKLLR